MNDNLPTEIIPASLSGPDAPPFPPTSPSHVLDLALLESVNLHTEAERQDATARAREIIADAEARAARLIAAAVADAEEQVAEVRPLAEAEAEKIVQEAKDEASSLISAGNEQAAEINTQAEADLANAQANADEIIAQARLDVAEFVKTLDIDRELIRERQENLDSREAAVLTDEQKAADSLARARTEADRVTTEAGETVDRMLRSGHVAAEARIDDVRQEMAESQALTTDYATDLREVTEQYETKLSNQNIENLELRQELEQLRSDLETIRDTPTPAPAREVEVHAEDTPVSTPDNDETGPSTDESPEHDNPSEDFVSPWLVPSEAAQPTDAPTPTVSSEPPGESASDVDDDLDTTIGFSTGLTPNTRLVEPLSASAFRPEDDKKKRRSKRRR